MFLHRVAIALGICVFVATVSLVLIWPSAGPATATGFNTIASPDTAGNVGLHTSLALDGAGNPVVSYYDASFANLKVLHCGNPSCTAGNTIASPDTAGSVGTYTSLALDASGNPVVSYFDSNTYDLKVLHCDDPNCSGDESGNIAKPDTTGIVGQYTSLALDGQGNPVVSYLDSTTLELKVLHCGNPICTAGNTIAFPAPEPLIFAGLHTSLALDGGNPVVSYYSYTNGGFGYLTVVICGNPYCTAGNIAQHYDGGASDVGRYTSLALTGGGDFMVSYYNANGRDLKVLYCGNPCTVTYADTTGNVGQYTSVAPDGSGNPVVSYYNANNIANTGDLKVLHCGNTACSAGNTIASPDTAGDVGQFTSLALDGAGNPVVSYYGNGDLKVLHCVNITCIDKPTPTPTRTPTPISTPTPTPTPLTPTPAPIKGNNDFAGSVVIPGPLPYSNRQNNSAATSFGDPQPCGTIGKTVWYSFTPSTNMVLVADTEGSNFDTMLAAYTGATLFTLVNIACDNDSGTYPLSRIQFSASAGVTYHFQAGAYSFVPGGNLQFNLRELDGDGDGCTDVREQQTAPGSELSGGRRDYLNPNDYFNPSGDLKNRVDDILLVVQAYFKDDTDGNPGLPPYTAGYNLDMDRVLPGGAPHPWSLQAGNGLQRVDDILNSVKQYFHDCS